MINRILYSLREMPWVNFDKNGARAMRPMYFVTNQYLSLKIGNPERSNDFNPMSSAFVNFMIKVIMNE